MQRPRQLVPRRDPKCWLMARRSRRVADGGEIVLAKAGKRQHAGVLGRLPPLSMPPHVAPKCAATAARMGLAMVARPYCRRQLLANAAIAASRVGSYPWPVAA